MIKVTKERTWEERKVIGETIVRVKFKGGEYKRKGS